MVPELQRRWLSLEMLDYSKLPVRSSILPSIESIMLQKISFPNLSSPVLRGHCSLDLQSELFLRWKVRLGDEDEEMDPNFR